MSEAIKPLDEDLEKINMFDPELMACPHAFFKKLRDEAPVYQDPNTGIFQVSKHELICKVARDAKLFSNQFGVIQRSGGGDYPQEAADIMANDGYPPVDTMLTADPPRHTRYRSLVDKAFSPKRVTDMGPEIEDKINYIIDQFYDQGKCDVSRDIAQQLPVRVIAEQLGVPLEDYDKFCGWSDAFVQQLSGTSSQEEHVEIAKQLVEFQQYFANRLKEKENNATDDIISDLANLDFEDDNGENEWRMIPVTTRNGLRFQNIFVYYSTITVPGVEKIAAIPVIREICFRCIISMRTQGIIN